MNSSTICSLFLGLILISQSPFAANARQLDLGGGGVPVVSVLCGSSSNKVECSKVLSSPQTAQAKNYQQLSKAVDKIAIKKAVKAEAFIKGLAQKSKSEALDTCASSYERLVQDFKSCLLFAEGDPETISYNCQLAIENINLCDRKMAGVNPAVTALNRQMSFFCELIAIIMHHLPNY